MFRKKTEGKRTNRSRYRHGRKLFALPAQALRLYIPPAPWARCDDSHRVIIAASNRCAGKVFFRVARLS